MTHFFEIGVRINSFKCKGPRVSSGQFSSIANINIPKQKKSLDLNATDF